MGGWTHGHTIETSKKLFLSKSLILLEEIYKNNKVKMKCECMLCHKITYKTHQNVRCQKIKGCGCLSNKLRQETNLKKYGVKNVSQSKEIREKTEKTCLKKYGKKSPLQSEKILNKVKATNLKKYGQKNVFQVPKFQETIRITNLEKYGVENPMHNSEIAERSLVNSYNKKEFTFPSGRKIYCQGYEPQALQLLLNEGLSEHDIIVERSLVPKISYYDLNNNKKLYYPDFYIPKDNLIIEVKSNYTFNINKKINMIKRRACVIQGYKYKFMIINKEKK